MSVHVHILYMFVATVIAWIAWLMVLVNVNPESAAWWGFALFYLTFFLSLFGTLTVIGFFIRSIVQLRRMTVRYKVVTSIRQAFLWSCALVAALALQSQRILSWWTFIAILIIFILIEFFIISMKKQIENET